MQLMKLGKKRIIIIISILFLVFLGWRFIRPMNIFVVDEKIAWPVNTSQVSAVLGDLSAKECGICHAPFYKEWQTAMHSQAWKDPYFQSDWNFDNRQHICRLCHTPLDRQQPHTVLGYRDKDQWDPVLKNNPNFDEKLQHEGVTCAACHYRKGKIVGVFGNTNAPHPVKKLEDPNQVCVRCHVIDGERWDTFFRFPPCGTVAEIKNSKFPLAENKQPDLLANLSALKEDQDIAAQMAKIKRMSLQGKSGEDIMSNTASLGCIQCHMPVVKRALVSGGKVRQTRHHYWRGGHDPEMVKKSLSVNFSEAQTENKEKRRFRLTIANTGAAHYVPTGTPDRYLMVQLRTLDKDNKVLDEKTEKMIRTVMWRPVIVDLWDTRLSRWQPRNYDIEFSTKDKVAIVEVVVSYHLLNERRRKRISYNNKTPISYAVFQKKIILDKNE